MKFLVLLASLMGLASATNSSNETDTNTTTITPHNTAIVNTSNETAHTNDNDSPTMNVNGTTSTTTTTTTTTVADSSGNGTANSTTTTTTTTMAAGVVMTSSVSLNVPFTGTLTAWCVNPLNSNMQLTIEKAYKDQTSVEAETTTEGCSRRQLSTRQLASHMYPVTFNTKQTYTDTAAATVGTNSLTSTNGLLVDVEKFKAAMTIAANALSLSSITILVSNITTDGWGATAPTATAASTTSSAAATGVATAVFSVLGLTALLA